jgi:hypothetical protein
MNPAFSVQAESIDDIDITFVCPLCSRTTRANGTSMRYPHIVTHTAPSQGNGENRNLITTVDGHGPALISITVDSGTKRKPMSVIAEFHKWFEITSNPEDKLGCSDIFYRIHGATHFTTYTQLWRLLQESLHLEVIVNPRTVGTVLGVIKRIQPFPEFFDYFTFTFNHTDILHESTIFNLCFDRTDRIAPPGWDYSDLRDFLALAGAIRLNEHPGRYTGISIVIG